MSQSVQPGRRIGDHRDDLRASLAAQSELGPQMSDIVARQFLREIEDAVDEKIETRISRHEQSHKSSKWLPTVTVVGSTTALVPLKAIGISTGGFEGFIGVFIAWCIVMFLDLVVLLRK